MKKLLGFLLLITATSAFAADKVAVEDTNPPPPETALLTSQIPPITTLGKPMLPGTEKPATPAGLPERIPAQ